MNGKIKENQGKNNEEEKQKVRKSNKKKRNRKKIYIESGCSKQIKSQQQRQIIYMIKLQRKMKREEQKLRDCQWH